jgi:D-lactate dehydrogenase (cytochrome)
VRGTVGANPFTRRNRPPALVAFPNTSNEVRTIVRACVTHRVPLVPFGAGTSLEGHVGAVQPESLSVDMSRLQEIFQLPQQPSHKDEDNNEEQPPDALVVVQAGVTREQLSQALRATGYQFTVDPGAATATIGGMVACNAAGTTTVRYGALRDNLLGVGCVLVDDDATLLRTTNGRLSGRRDIPSITRQSRVAPRQRVPW